MLAVLSLTHFVTSSGYLAIFVLSVAQSCCVPTSSELVMALAGYLAYKHQLNLPAVIVVGAGGELIGAYIAWVIGRTGGRAFVGRYGRYVLLTRTDLDRAEAWYGRHRRGGVFIGRLIPVVRNFVALVAGVAEVPLVAFGIFTALGSLIWDGAWAGVGYGIGSKYTKITKDFSDAGYLIAVLVIIALVVAFVHRWRAYKHLRAIEDRDTALADAAAPHGRPAAAAVPRSKSGPQHRRRPPG
jgi:membrane protein DedA with SNARE-associated domain